MNLSLLALAALPLLALACSDAPADDARTGAADEALDEAALAAIPRAPFADVCQPATTDRAKCFARRRTTASGDIVTFAAPSGLTPADLVRAYKIPTPAKTAARPVIGIVDAQDDPRVETDLAIYREQFGLPACTTANGCFRKVNQEGVAGSYPPADPGWASEIALDVEMASAACPRCSLVLVEAKSESVTNLGIAVNEAVKLGATVVSNSFGWPEATADAADDGEYWHHAGVTIFASSGDSGYGVIYPSSGQYVIGVGGTSLARSSSARGWAEKAWAEGGSGCSKKTTKPSWQTDATCKKKVVADVSAVGDPDTGVAVYDSFGSGGWTELGGTSVSSPLVAGIFAAAGKGGIDAADIWEHPSDFTDITSGANGTCATGYYCKAGKGYDGPTGWGSPIGSKLSNL